MKGHPMLRGKQRKDWQNHGFSTAQIKSLAVICDTFVPLLEKEEEAESFYLLYGSQNGLPDQVAHMMRWRVKAAGVLVAKWVLWLLSTRLGTWILCGSACFTARFPYLQTFEQIPQLKRERIMLDWSQGKRFAFLKFVFKLFKICCLFAFYSSADENGENPAWKSIGYCPPDRKGAMKKSERPLDNGVIDLSGDPDQDLAALFKGRGFTVGGGGGGRRGNWRVECDAVVVGSGSGGGVAAATLAQAGHRVIVVEKGNYYARQDLTLLEGPSFERMYDSGGLLSTNDARILIMAGSTVGGGSAINWSACIPTPPHILADWAQQYQLPLFATDHYQNAMEAVWHRLGVQDRCSNHSFQNSILRDGCTKLGFTVHDVPRNSTEDHFCGSCCYGCPTGDKKGTDETWLVDAVNAGAVILTGCKAEKVSVAAAGGGGKKKRATGVVATAVNGGRSRRIFVQAKVTVVACGALQTPPLLRRSGLRNPNIGRNLHLHPVQMAWGYFPEGKGESKQHHGKSYEGGIITAMCKEGGSINQTPAVGPGSFAAMMPWTSGLDMKERMLKFSRTAHVFALVRDRGSGTVMAEKEIEYRIGESDKEKLREGLGRAVRILIAAGAAEVGTHRSDGLRFVAEGASQGEIDEFVNTVASDSKSRRSLWSTVCSAHQIGSCRMGKDEDSGGVDWKGEAWEVGGLFVCDGSVLPTALGVNPMFTIQSVALWISKHILQFLHKYSPSSKLGDADADADADAIFF